MDQTFPSFVQPAELVPICPVAPKPAAPAVQMKNAEDIGLGDVIRGKSQAEYHVLGISARYGAPKLQVSGPRGQEFHDCVLDFGQFTIVDTRCLGCRQSCPLIEGYCPGCKA